ncbi:ATP/GTP-binding protein [Saccharopolyspora sp. K220]|uniref:GTP-binding protein n=1 Tax=Saccharopolyspora soli TaxID=2926618 RepID=UPI001F58D5BC|nr:ATP/GTP-binding protein [Saccharopolyspora soli]MCI2422905.1 ATP/GTP-binding protein [Saccharopolyspora soli]
MVVGHFGVGKTTFVGTLSEIPPVSTEEVMTQASTGVDDLTATPEKVTTTVALDFGRRTITEQLVLYLFGTPGQHRFLPLWEDWVRGALGALVLVDTRSLAASFEIIGLVEERGLPYAVAVNPFPDSPGYSDEMLRESLDLLPSTPLLHCDVRDIHSAGTAAAAVVEHALATLPATREPVS